MAKKPTWVELLRERRQRLFVGRTEEIAAFRRNFEGLVPRYLVFALQGEPGVGKSFLIACLQEVARESGALTALTGGTEARALREQAILSTMSRLAAGLAEAGAPLRTFEQRYREYRGCIAEVERDSAAPHSASDVITPLALRWIERVSAEDNRAAAGEAEITTWSAYLGQRFPSRETVALVAAPVETLTPIFVRELNQLAEKRPLVLCFDDWGQTAAHLSEWLRSLFQREGLSAGVWFVIAGRVGLDERWDPFRPLIARFELGAFSEEETRDYLRQQGVFEEARIRQIVETSGGLPLYVSALSSVRGGAAEAAAAQPAERYLAWLDDPRHRQCVVYCAAARRVDSGVLRALMGEAENEDLSNWLAGVPFVRHHDDRSSGAYWDYHPLMRRLLLEFALSRSSRVGQALHARLRACYRDRYADVDAGDRRPGADTPQAAALVEALYHGLMQESDDAIREGLDVFLRSLRRDVAMAGQVVQTWLQAGAEQRSSIQVTRWADLLDRAWRGMQAEAWSMVLPLCAALEARESNLSRAGAATALSAEARSAAYLLHATASLTMGDYGGAVERLGRTMELEPENRIARRLRDLAYRELRDTARAAERDARQRVQAAVEVARPVERDAHSRAQSGDATWPLAPQATSDLDRLLAYALVPPEDALSYSNQSVVMNPDETLAYFNHGTYDEVLASEPAGREPVADVLAPGSPSTDHEFAAQSSSEPAPQGPVRDAVSGARYRNEGLAHAQLRDYARALESYGQAIMLDPQHAGVYHDRGLVYCMLKEYRRAAQDFEQAIELDPAYALAYYDRGRAYAGLRDYPKAIEDFTRIIELEPGYAPAYQDRGSARLALGQYAEAIDDFDQAIKMDPSLAAAYYNSACAHVRMGRRTDALRCLETAVELDRKYRKMARADTDFEPLRGQEQFRRLVEAG